MFGAIVGDIIGSIYEWNNIKTKDFPLFRRESRYTDDTVMTCAVAEGIMNGGTRDDFIDALKKYGRMYPHAGYGGRFKKWLFSEDREPYYSYGNGAAMRVSPCGFAAKTLEEAVAMADAVTKVTHNHPEGMKGAAATAAAIFLARSGKTREEIREYIVRNYYPLNFTLDEIRPTYTFDVSCQGSVPQALEAFLESVSFEDAIRNAISIGGDSDTIAAITGGVSEAYYGVPEEIRDMALSYLDDTQTEILIAFSERYMGL